MTTYTITHAVEVCEPSHALSLASTKLAERKATAYKSADSTAHRIFALGSGKLARESRAFTKEKDLAQCATDIGLGNFKAFSTIIGALFGKSTDFATEKSADGKVVRKGAEKFRAYAAVIEDNITQLAATGKHLNSKGAPSTAAHQWASVSQLHRMALVVMDERTAQQRDAAAARHAALQAEKGAV
jgi:hypothetical protein